MVTEDVRVYKLPDGVLLICTDCNNNIGVGKDCTNCDRFREMAIREIKQGSPLRLRQVERAEG